MQKTAYEWRISDWSSDVCSSDLRRVARGIGEIGGDVGRRRLREIAVDVLCQPRRDAESLLGASDGLVEQLVPAQRAVVALRGREHRDRARDAGGAPGQHRRDRQSVVLGKGVSERVDLDVGRVIKKKNIDD